MVRNEWHKRTFSHQIRILLLDEVGFVFPVRVAWLTAAVVGLSVLLPQLVGLWPALRATRTRIPEGIAYE